MNIPTGSCGGFMQFSGVILNNICYLKNIDIFFSDVDVILISNYNYMLALPYITENTGFK